MLIAGCTAQQPVQKEVIVTSSEPVPSELKVSTEEKIIPNKTETVQEEITPAPLTAKEPKIIKTAIFKSVEHMTSGNVKFIELPDGKKRIVLESFRTEPGPDLYVYAVKKGQQARDGFKIAELTSITGSQQYELPDDFDVMQYEKIVVLSYKHNVIFGEAKLD